MHAKIITYQFDGLAQALVTFSALALLRFCSCSASLLACCARVCLDWTVCKLRVPDKKKIIFSDPSCTPSGRQPAAAPGVLYPAVVRAASELCARCACGWSAARALARFLRLAWFLERVNTIRARASRMRRATPTVKPYAVGPKTHGAWPRHPIWNLETTVKLGRVAWST